MGKHLIAFLMLFVLTQSVFAQNKSTLNEKWTKTMENAETYEVYKVIKKSELNDVWKSVQDTVARYQSDLKEERTRLKSQYDTITRLHGTIVQLQAEVVEAKSGTENIHFWGGNVNKYTYTTVLWILLIFALAGAGILFFLFKNRNKVTQQSINEYQHLSSSFDEYKLGKIEMERKLKREIQTQANRLEELKKK